MGALRYNLTIKEVNNILNLLSSKLPIDKIVKETGRSRSTIYRIIRNQNKNEGT